MCLACSTLDLISCEWCESLQSQSLLKVGSGSGVREISSGLPNPTAVMPLGPIQGTVAIFSGFFELWFIPLP